jgi:two-component system sensor histidine kinase VicK
MGDTPSLHHPELLASDYGTVKALLESLSNGVVLFDRDRHVVLTNPAITNMTGLSQETFNLEDFIKLFGHDTVDLDAKIRDALTTAKTVHIENIKLSSLFFYEIFINPVLSDRREVAGGVIILHDITHMQEVARMESEFISVASHQLRTPMTAIQWVAERLLKKEQMSPEGRAYLEDIHNSVKRLSELVDILLNASRIDGGKIGVAPEDIEVVSFIRSYFEECAPLAAKKKLRLSLTDAPAELHAKLDRSALRNIAQSIISNAIEYTPEGGSIGASLEAGDGAFTFTVRDTGIGIPQGEQKDIFKKFSRASNAKRTKTDGTGLGMYIAKQATDLLGGGIRFVSEEGRGTTVYVTLPLEAVARTGTRTLIG